MGDVQCRQTCVTTVTCWCRGDDEDWGEGPRIDYVTAAVIGEISKCHSFGFCKFSCLDGTLAAPCCWWPPYCCWCVFVLLCHVFLCLPRLRWMIRKWWGMMTQLYRHISSVFSNLFVPADSFAKDVPYKFYIIIIHKYTHSIYFPYMFRIFSTYSIYFVVSSPSSFRSWVSTRVTPAPRAPTAAPRCWVWATAWST